MRILFVSDTYYPHLNGVYYFVCRIAPLLEEKGHRVAVVAPSETTRFTKKWIDNIEVFGVPSMPILLYPKIRFPIPFLLSSRVERLLKSWGPDVIHLQDHFMLSRAVLRANKRIGAPILGTNHFMPENLTSLVRSEKWKKRLEKLMWARFSKVYDQLMLVTTPTETAARLIRPKLNVEVKAISSGIDLGKFNPSGDAGKIRDRYGIPDKRILLFVGRLDPEKKLEDVLAATALALKQVDFCLVIVGKGLRKSALEDHAADLGITGNVFFTGFIPEEDLPFFYKMSRCFIIASIAELLSLAMLQAMATGLPVIAARAGALGELIRERVNGLLFDVGDIDGMVRCILEMFNNDTLWHSISGNNLEDVRQHDIHATVRSFERIYQGLGWNDVRYDPPTGTPGYSGKIIWNVHDPRQPSEP
jgi:1,2-diacylglycerol 3-alpha-glucosyltransferase